MSPRLLIVLSQFVLLSGTFLNAPPASANEGAALICESQDGPLGPGFVVEVAWRFEQLAATVLVNDVLEDGLEVGSNFYVERFPVGMEQLEYKSVEGFFLRLNTGSMTGTMVMPKREDGKKRSLKSEDLIQLKVECRRSLLES